ncbi:GNAT family acetyltransferase (plasmid) [Natrialba magadii ATCC 43099]|uniref:GNAT family acetyltransferase n=1 Tax=Natrialba magadii (strain ATCC 43099 / DSM 3394 / CCM 3739 / CIP 104546 / IAM 13178 / JCM 8861 / NBRC 102185 / NCIMB 2190 / MS3) TaxID=547559 RepID=D3T271_NATMM|nr:GNAT family N-acetyltransferase [Natrialba magadii]ADD07680.1 GNAT family acetyltransferase [Natrialba magadii ATCC 43099]ELY26490.1 N-acetyltransferase GCN5 [Natrialba magadii ATCC 43099]
MQIRTLKGPDDIAGVVRTHGLAWREAYTGVLPENVLEQVPTNPNPDVVERWYERVKTDRDRFLVAVDDGFVRGYAYFRWGHKTKEFVGEAEAGLKEIYVHPDDWGKGIGTELLHTGLEMLPKDLEAVSLEMLSGNDVGSQFYEARGFEQIDERTYRIGERSYPTEIYRLSLPDSDRNH